MRSVTRNLLAVVVLLTTSCATIIKDENRIHFSSKKEPARVYDMEGSYLGTTPFDVSVQSMKKIDYIQVISDNYKKSTQKVDLFRPGNTELRSVFWLNILFIPGLIFDLATDTGHTVKDNTINIKLKNKR